MNSPSMPSLKVESSMLESKLVALGEIGMLRKKIVSVSS